MNSMENEDMMKSQVSYSVNIYKDRLKNPRRQPNLKSSPKDFDVSVTSPSHRNNRDQQEKMEKLKEPFLGSIPQVPKNILPLRHFQYSFDLKNKLLENQQSRANVGYYEHRMQDDDDMQNQFSYRTQAEEYDPNTSKFTMQHSKQSLGIVDIQHDA